LWAGNGQRPGYGTDGGPFVFALGRKRRKPKRGERIEPRLVPRRDAGRVPAARGGGKKRRRRSFALRLVSFTLTLGLLGVLAGGLATAYVYVNLEKQGLFHIPEREPGIMLLSADGQIVAERGSFFGDAVRLDELPTYVPQAVIAIEDRRFYSHFGIDPLGLARAMIANIRAGRVVQGGSTLTQQLAKNLFLEPARTYERKFQEAVLALWLENKFSKDEILQLYLNRVYYGSGATGIDKAAQAFFAKSARDVSLPEAAILAAVLKAPTTYNPISHPDKAAARAREVIADMVEVGFITQEQAERAQNVKANVRAADYLPASQYIVDWVAEQLPDVIGKFDTSIVVETTIDRHLQTLAEKSLQRALEGEGEKLSVSQGAAVVLDANGAVKAMVGGKSYIKSQYNRAVKAKRQPGSAFKPFVYLTAIEQGFTPESIEVDEPVKFGDWSPENYRRKYLGPVSLRKAIAMSLNTVAAKLAMAVGPANVVATAHRLGIVSDLEPNASIALGTSEVTLLELTAALSPFANGGRTVIPYVVTRISTRDGRILYERQGDGFGITVTDYEVGAMNDMLRAVIGEGTGRGARLEPHDVAGKTGTSQDYRDAWFIGYSTYYVAGVWVGNDDNSPTAKVTGGNLPAAIWREIMADAHKELAPSRLPGEWRQQEVPMVEFQQDDRGGFFGVFQSMFGTGQAPADSGLNPQGSLDDQQRQQRLKQRQKQLLDSR
jgi:penicillin-binding protein 1A